VTIIIAIPSKGRLKERSVEIFAEAGLPIDLPTDARSYRGGLPSMPGVEIAFMSASEIARELVAGNIHLGITGEDLARETVSDADAVMEICVPLQFGHADVVVAVPESWIDVDTMADLDDVAAEFRQRHGRRLRIATKYWQLTQNFFAGHGIAVYRIVESLGATEGAPAAGTADVIVDITSTGSTLQANHLKILADGVILRSQACLIRSRSAHADRATSAKVSDIARRIGKSLKSDAN
jgi:ATP phosphoribosyltransferase